MAQELEIKLTLGAGAMDAAQDWLSAQPQASVGSNRLLVNTYYDSPEGCLNRQKAALRVRQIDGDRIQTLKTKGQFVDGMHQREEWEWPLTAANLNLALLADTPLGDEVDLKKLAPVFETNFHRQVIMIDDGEAVIECAVDRGAVIASDRQRPLSEVEFELVSGNPRSLLVWAERLAQECPVFVNLTSKAEQGYYLAGLYAPKIRESQPDVVIELFQRMSTAWLTDSAVNLDGLDVKALATIARSKSVTDLFEHVMSQLTNGSSPDELMTSAAPGRLQLALLM
jgi:inorganic triphosphatase YgiF